MSRNKCAIVVVSPSMFPGTAGDSANYLELVNGFNRRGLQVTLVCPKAPGREGFDEKLRETGVKVTRVPLAPPRISDLIRMGPAASLVIRLLVFWILEVFFVAYAIMRNRARVCMIRHSIPTIPLAPFLHLLRVRSVADGEILSGSREWETFFSPSMRRFLSLVEKWRLYTLFKVTSKVQEDDLTALGFPPNRIIMTGMGIDISRIPSLDVLTIAPATFGFFGALTEWQGLDFLLRSFAKTVEKNKVAKLYIIGDGPIKGNLLRLSTRLGLGEKVTFCKAVPRKTLWRDYFKKFRVAVAPYRKGIHQSIKIVEALAAGKPVIVTALESLRYLQGKGVFFVQPGNEDEMARAMALLAEDECLLGDLSKQALVAAQEFDIGIQIGKILKALGH